MSREFTRDVRELTEKLTKCVVKENVNAKEQSSLFVPDRNIIISIIVDLRKLLFPVQYAPNDITNCTLDYYIGNLLLEIENKLYKQIRVALMRNEDYNEMGVTQEVADKAAEISTSFMKRIPYIHEMLYYDIEAFFQGDPAAHSKDDIILSYPGMFAIMIYRIAHELYNLNIPLIPRMMTEYGHTITGVDINPGAEIGKYFFIDHATGVVIGETCKIADHVKLYQGVTLGALSLKEGHNLEGKKRHPTIEDDVTIYSNATVLGGDTIIGKGAIIGGSCFITESIPAGARVQTVSDIILKQSNKKS